MTASSPISTGPEDTPVPASTNVFRLYTSNDGKVPPQAFELSTADKNSRRPRLSVFLEGLTTLEQARNLGSMNKTHAGFLPVDDVRAVRPDPENAEVKLDVEWERARDEKDEVVTAAGADGHCGIWGLQGGTKPQRLSLRRKLADLANRRTQPLRAPA